MRRWQRLQAKAKPSYPPSRVCRTISRCPWKTATGQLSPVIHEPVRFQESYDGVEERRCRLFDLNVHSVLVLPLIYGIGTALPVLVVAGLLAYSAQAVGKTYNILGKVEWWARMTTGWMFILVGIYFNLNYVFEAM